MSGRSFGVVAVLLAAGAVLAGATSPPRSYRLEAVPAEPGEAALRDAVTRSGFAGPQATAEALRTVSAAFPGTAVSGLAQLGAGLALLDAGRPADAVPALRGSDIARTSLLDRALFGLAQAHEGQGALAEAGSAYVAAADARPDGPVVCPALFRAAESFLRADRSDAALAALGRALGACPGQEPRTLLRIGEIRESRREPRGAAEAYDRLDREYPASAEARPAATRLSAIASLVPPSTPEARTERAFRKAQAVFDAGRYSEATPLFRALLRLRLSAEDADRVRVRLGRSLLAQRQWKAAEAQLVAVTAGSPHGAEAAFHLAHLRARRGSVDAYESVAARFPGTPWAEEALFALASRYQKDALEDQALTYYRRLLQEFPDGRFADRAVWRVAWADFRAGRFAEAAQALERVALARPAGSYTPGCLYWAGRARRELGELERARQLFEETVRRYKNTYHGMRAREALAQLPPPGSEPPALRATAGDPRDEIPEPQLARIRQLLLLDRLEEAAEELRPVSAVPAAQATIAWIEWRRGRLRPAIIAMKRAYPEYLGEGGDELPEEVWRILYPIDFRDALVAKASEEGLDPALVAAIIWQESTFNPGAVSRAGARGLMQVIPRTGRTLAKRLGIRYRTTALYDPAVSLDFGTRYLKEMLERFGGRVERALAAYNAGPERVEVWTAARPEMSAEEFIESIPFSETRNYVMTILAGREHYRRIHSLAVQGSAATAAAAAERP